MRLGSLFEDNLKWPLLELQFEALFASALLFSHCGLLNHWKLSCPEFKVVFSSFFEQAYSVMIFLLFLFALVLHLKCLS